MANFDENPLKLSDFRAILSWYGEMGVDTAICETPTDWLQSEASLDHSWAKFKARPLALSATNHPQAPFKAPAHTDTTPNLDGGPTPPQTQRRQERRETWRQASPPSPSKPAYTTPDLTEARKIAKSCSSLKELGQALHAFDGCNLKRTAKNLVFYRGSEAAPLMVIGEAPGREEDIVGKPFVGRAGQLLDRMLKAIERDETTTHITNIVYWRPPGNRTPTAEEAAICRPFLDRQIELVQPKLILFLGGAAAKQMYETTTGITKLRGKWQTIPGGQHTMPTLATLHPAYLLRTPIAKRLASQDLQMIKEKLDE